MANPRVQQAHALIVAGEFAKAEVMLRPYVLRANVEVDLLDLMSIALKGQGKLVQAEHMVDRAIAQMPNSAILHLQRGDVRMYMHKHEAAYEDYRRASELEPTLAGAQSGMGACATKLGRVIEALERGRRAIALDPSDVNVHINHCAALTLAGEMRECVQIYAAILDRTRELTFVLSALLSATNYDDQLSGAQLFAAQREALRRHLPPTAQRTFQSERSPDRPLNVGILSSDLRRHAVAKFLEPILRTLPRDQFRVLAFAAGYHDDVSDQLKPLFDEWHAVANISDAALGDLVVSKRVDILIDLNGFTTNTRIWAMVPRLAPVQVNYLGYPASTMIETIDARIVDAITDPAPQADALATEKLVRLDRCFLCYLPPSDAPMPSGRQSDPKAITFGCFNNIAKLSDSCMRVWATAINAVPGSRLVLKNESTRDPLMAERLAERVVSHGVARERIIILPFAKTSRDHLASHDQIDIALDCWPYNGTTTTCDALLMGVPVVTLAGDRHVWRVGASLNHAMGLDELTAHSPEEFVGICTRLAADGPRLNALRASLRARFLASPLCDQAELGRAMTKALRSLWHDYCQQIQ